MYPIHVHVYYVGYIRCVTIYPHQSSRWLSDHQFLCVHSMIHLRTYTHLYMYILTSVSTMLYNMQLLWEVGGSSVCCVHTTTEGVVLAALADGRVMIFNTVKKTRSFIEPEKDCSQSTGGHGDIVAMHSLLNPQLLVMGFSSGKVHVYNCQGGIQDSLVDCQDHYCSHLSNDTSLHSLLCILVPSSPSSGDSGGSTDVMEVWCGTSSSSVVIWEYSLTSNLRWVRGDHIERTESVVPVCKKEHASSKKFTAKNLKFNADANCVVALLHQPHSQVSSLALINAANKTLLHCLTCRNISGV